MPMKIKEDFELKISNRLTITILIFLSFFLSFFLILLSPDSRTHYLIKYPVAFSDNLSSYELHFLKKHGNPEGNADALVKDFFLGPFNFQLERYFNPLVKVNNTILRGRVLYIDLSPEEMVFPLIFDENEFFNSVKMLKNTILNNLQTIKEIKITFDGQELSSSFFSI